MFYLEEVLIRPDYIGIFKSEDCYRKREIEKGAVFCVLCIVCDRLDEFLELFCLFSPDDSGVYGEDNDYPGLGYSEIILPEIERCSSEQSQKDKIHPGVGLR